MASPRWLLAVLAALCHGAPGDPRCSERGTFDAEWDECNCFTGYGGDTCESCADGLAGWPHCQRLPGGAEGAAGAAGGGVAAAEQAYGWAQLCPEVAALRANLPDFVARLGEAYEARQVVSQTRALQHRRNGSAEVPFFLGAPRDGCGGPTGSQGPWRLKVDLAPPEGAPAAYQKQHRLVLVFDQHWPVALPRVRFVGKLQSGYAIPSDDYHVNEANGLLVRRLQEAAGGAGGCMWRQTGSCAADGSHREPEMDRPCSDAVPSGASGFCDCDGDGEKGGNESGYSCGSSPSSCLGICDTSAGSSADGSGGLPRHSLRRLLELLHRSLAEPLHSSDRKTWRLAASDFEETTRTARRYETYGRKHPELFRIGGVPDERMIDPELLKLIGEARAEPSRKAAKKRLLSSGLISEVLGDLVFSFRVLRLEFCEFLMEEIRHFYASKLPAKRPNSMNNYGIILNDIGLEPLIFAIQDAVVQPLAAILLPTEGSELESHHAFTIRYRGGEDTHLDVHTDDSDVTFNVNIFGNYTGAPLVFCGLVGAPDHRHFRTAYQHELGYAVLHRGRHRHGAEDITSGERMNLVVWSYSHNYRSSSASEKRHKRERSPPDTRCVSYTHDRDFGQFRSWPAGKKEQFLGRGWCPPRGKEYEGFVPDVPDNQARHSGQ